MKKIILISTIAVAIPAVYLQFHVYLYMKLSTVLSYLYEQIGKNELLKASILSAASLGFAYYAQRAIYFVYLKVRAMFISSVSIKSIETTIYFPVVDFITERYLSKIKGAKGFMQASVAKKNRTWKERRQECLLGAPKTLPLIDLRPSSSGSFHKFEFEGTEISFYRERGETVTVGHARIPMEMETITLSMWGLSTDPILKLINLAVAAAHEKEEEGINIYVRSNSWIGGFEKAFTRAPRKNESVILDVDHANIILEDAKNFLSKAAWYNDMGIPYRRGYLLHGPPGCGKSSFALVLASELKLNICILTLSGEGIDDNNLAEALRDAPDSSIVLLEDVDAIFVERKSKANSGVSFSGLLNAIDGVAAQEGRILLMTTNHIERLDPALIRPGRCDVLLQLTKASKLQLERMFLRFFPGSVDLATQFKNRLPADELSMAQLQGHFLEYSLDAEQCVENIPKLLDRSRPKTIVEASAFDYLNRVGLERYTAYVEFLGVHAESDFESLMIDDLLDICPELRLDIDSLKKFKKLLAKDQKFMANDLSFPNIAAIRESFLAAYPTLHEVQYGERDPLFRVSDRTTPREGGSLSRPVLSRQSSASDISYIISQIFDGGNCFQKTNDISTELLDKLSREFVSRLSVGGKSVVSMHQLNNLLAAYPYRPVQCVHAVRSLNFQRPETSYLRNDMSTYQLLKRLDCMSDIHTVEAMERTASALLRRADNNRGHIDIPRISSRIIELMKSDVKKIDENLISFQLLNRKKIMAEFSNFYRPYLQNATDEQKSLKGSIGTGTDKEKELEEMAYEFATKLSNCLGNSQLSLYELKSYFEKASASIDVGSSVSTPYGSGVVKVLRGDGMLVIEASNWNLANGKPPVFYMMKIAPPNTTAAKLLTSSSTAQSPDDALKNINLLTDPPRPEAPRPSPPPERKERIYGWLASGGFAPGEVNQYGDAFVYEKICTEDDVRNGDTFDIPTLEKLNIRKIGHQRKIIFMQKQL